MEERKSCTEQDKEIMELKAELGIFKKDIYHKFNDIMEKLNKPILTDKERYTLIISLIVYLIFTINYISANNFRSIENEKSIEAYQLSQEKQNERIWNLLVEIKGEVGDAKGSKTKE